MKLDKEKIIIILIGIVLFIWLVGISIKRTGNACYPYKIGAWHSNEILIKLHFCDTVNFIPYHKVPKNAIIINPLDRLNKSDTCNFLTSKIWSNSKYVCDTISSPIYTYSIHPRTRIYLNVIERPKLTLKTVDTIFTNCGDTIKIVRYE